jgi:hypothetical protein
VSLYKGLVTSCFAGTRHNKGIPYNTSMTKSQAAWSDTVAVRGRACALAGLLVGLQSPSQKTRDQVDVEVTQTQALTTLNPGLPDSEKTLRNYARLHRQWCKVDLLVMTAYQAVDGNTMPWECTAAKKTSRSLDLGGVPEATGSRCLLALTSMMSRM